MKLVETVLRTSQAEKHIPTFQAYCIDVHTLKELSDEDLIILGVQDENKRQTILQHAANLQVNSQIRFDIDVNEQYLEEVLQQMTGQLNKHCASLSVALRKEIIVCDIKLNPATVCLDRSLELLNKELDFYNKTILNVKTNRKKRSKKLLILPILASAITMLVSFKMYKLLS